ncbi:MAG: hypothetical protein EXQ91_07755 [Alphaproteobacteria bacterium]|nr:hypothetical protein [Alphaproteobacteria bacterium]
MSEDDVDIDDYPSLVAGVRFMKSIGSVPWFARAGEPLDEETIADAQAYAEALGFMDVTVAAVEWSEVASLADEADIDPRSIEVELATVLANEAAAEVGGDNVVAVMADTRNAIDKAVLPLIRQCLKTLDVDGNPDQIVEAALDVAQRSFQGALLVILALAPEDHVFARKFRLFERGRWPLGIIGNTFHVL